MDDPDKTESLQAQTGLEPLPWFEDEGIERVPKQTPKERPGQSEEIQWVPALYLDDILAIHYKVSKHSKEIEMNTDEFRFHHPLQLRVLPQDRIAELTIKAIEPNLSVKARGNSCTITTFSDDPISQELFEEIKTIVLRRQNRLVASLGDLGYVTALVVPWVVAFAVLGIAKPRDSIVLATLLIALTLMLATPFVFKYSSTSRRGVIVPLYKREVPRAWYLSDTMKVTLVSNIITAILSILGTALILGN